MISRSALDPTASGPAWQRRAALAAIMALAGYLRLAHIADLGYANHYYTAAITSIGQSWHNFFFLAAEPGAALSVDKPPVGLWLQALSAQLFGINGFAMVLPQIVAGLLAILTLYRLVGRPFGPAAGLLAALALAITPVSVAIDRNNTMDSALILSLLLAAWAWSAAAETGRLRHLLLGAALVGIGFNIKMLQALLPLPAFYALYLLGARLPAGRKTLNLALATLVLAGVALAWALAVELTPSGRRPYIGSSATNSMVDLMLDYNGMKRLLGQDGALGTAGGRGAGWGQAAPDLSNPDPLRLFKPALGKEASWLLPFGLVGLLALAASRSGRVPAPHAGSAALLWGGWLLSALVFFSLAEFFHEYYLAMLAPPLAALVGIGTVLLSRLAVIRPWLAGGLLIMGGGATLALQQNTLAVFDPAAGWRPLPPILAALGGATLLLASGRRSAGGWRIGAALTLGALHIAPLIWAAQTMLNPSANQSLPGAYAGAARRPPAGLEVNQALLDYLAPRTQAARYLFAVPTAMQGADYVIATGRPVLYLGGFLGIDPVVSAADLARLVAGGELRYVYWGASAGPPVGNAAQITAWIAAACQPVGGFDSVAQNFGAPGGTTARPGPIVRGGYAIRLYDCAALSP